MKFYLIKSNNVIGKEVNVGINFSTIENVGFFGTNTSLQRYENQGFTLVEVDNKIYLAK